MPRQTGFIGNEKCWSIKMTRHSPAGHEQTVALDWAIAGIGAIGDEIATLVAVTLQFLEVDVSLAEALDNVVFEGYLTGLRDAGWRGDPRMAPIWLCCGCRTLPIESSAPCPLTGN